MTLDYRASSETGGGSGGGGLRELIHGNPQLATWLGVAIIVVTTLLAYVPAMRSDFIWDDDYYVTNNPLLRNWEGLQRIWFDVIHPSEYELPQYYPMTHTSFWLEYRLWGFNPTGYHVTNILLHICDALLVWLILRKLDVPGAFVAGAIFALHPINVESAAWIAERKNVLSLLFYLSSLYVYLRYAGVIRGATRAEAPPSPEKQTQIEWFTLPDEPSHLYALAAVLFLFALFSKTIASSMPVVALLIIWWKRGGKMDPKRDVVPLLPLFAVGFAMGMLTAYMERIRVGVALRPQDWVYASTPLGQFGARCIIAGRAFWFYLGKVFVPYPLMFNYPRWELKPDDALQYLYPIGALALLVVLCLARKRIGYGPFVALAYYSITLFPAMGFVNVWPMRYSFVADHFAYFSVIGVIALIAAVLAKYLSLEVFTGLTTVAVLVCMGLSFGHEQLFKDPETLWRTTWSRSGHKSWMAANNYGALLLDRPAHSLGERLKFLDGAEQSFNLAIGLKHDHPEARLNLARVYLARAEIDTELARAEASTQPSATSQPAVATAATPALAAAPATAPATAPTAAPTTIPTAQVAADYDRAMKYLDDAIHVQPNFVEAYMLRGRLFRRLGDDRAAARDFNQALDIHPRNREAQDELGSLAMKNGNYQEAADHFLRAAEIEPDSAQAHAALGTALLRGGHLPEGLGEWEEAMRLAPNDPDLPNDFGAQMADAGEYNKAVDYLQRARQIDPENPSVLTNLGVVAAKTGYTDKARQLFEYVIKNHPDFETAKRDLEELKSGRLRPATTRPTTRATAAASRPGR